MKRVEAAYVSDNIYVRFSGNAVISHYGIPGSPLFIEIEDVEIEYLELFNVPVNANDLPVELQNAILEMSDLISDSEWKPLFELEEV